MNYRELQALRLVNCGTGMGLTAHANALVSRQAAKLLAAGLIRYAPEKWIAYEPTPKGLAVLAANPRPVTP